MWGKKKNARSTAQETAKNWKKDSGESISSFKSKAKKANSSTRTTLQFLNFPFPPPLPPHTKNKNSAETNNQITTQNNVRHNRQKRKRGKEKKTVIKFCLEKSLCFSHRQRQQSHKAEQRRVHIEVGVENECITTSYYNSGGTRRQKLLPLARTIDSTAATTATECRVMSSHKSKNQTTLLLLLLLSSSSCTS